MQFRYICHLHLPCIVIFPVVPWFQNIGCLQGMSGGLCQEDSLCASCGVWRAIHWNLHRAGQRFTRLDRLPLGLIRSMVNLSHMGLFNQPECDVFFLPSNTGILPMVKYIVTSCSFSSAESPLCLWLWSRGLPQSHIISGCWTTTVHRDKWMGIKSRGGCTSEIGIQCIKIPWGCPKLVIYSKLCRCINCMQYCRNMMKSNSGF